MANTKCKFCGKEYKYTHHDDGTYKYYCCLECKEKAEKTKEYVCKNCGKKYIVQNPGSWNKDNKLITVKGKNLSNSVVSSKNFCCYECGKEYRSKKVKETNLKRYGNEVASKSQVIKNKMKVTLNNRTQEQIKEINKKRKNTCLEKYGCEFVNQNEEIKQKLKSSLKKTYEENNEAIRQKTIATNLQRYGVEYYTKTKEQKEKAKRTNLEKFGVEYATQSKEIQNKIKETNLKRYGVKAVTQLDVMRQKLSDRNKNRTTEEKAKILEKSRATNLVKYGVEYPSQNDEVRKKVEKTNLNRYGKKTSFNYDKIKETNLKKYGVEYTLFLAKNPKTISKINLNFQKALESNGITSELEFPLKNYSYDFKIGNILIEINPTFTHNSTEDVFTKDLRIPKKEKSYHANKSEIAKENGYRCIHIWDWDDENKIIKSLTKRIPLYARKLTLKKVSLDECGEFLNSYHFQNSCNGQSVRIGLYNKDELIQVMTFGKPRYNKTYEWELLRLCTKPGYYVIGGAEKLFNYFLRNFHPKSIISYCDNSKFTGEVYLKIGMKLKSKGKPSKNWFNTKTSRHITDNLLRQRGYSQLHKDYNYELAKRGDSNEQLMLESGYLEVFDCGQSSYVWNG